MLPLPIRSPQLSIVSASHSAPLPLPIKQVEIETYRQRSETEIGENSQRGKEGRREKFTKFTKYLGARMKNNVSGYRSYIPARQR